MSEESIMSDNDPTQQFPKGLQTKSPLGEDLVTVEEFLSRSAETDDLETMLALRPPRRKLPLPTMLLASAMLIGAGVAGGVEIQKHFGTSSPGGLGSLASVLGSRNFPSRSSSGGSSGFPSGTGSFLGGSGSANTTIGTVLLVDGSTIYVTTSSGGVVKVKTTPSTTVQVTQSGSVSDLEPGSTVVITGSGSGGTVTAKSVSQSSSSSGNTG
jgi:hypothetical protein